jgi:2-polyprenyl-3-methyl-5-hydroxy-6-metoxy-1,4-benzoquinol methylase
MINRIHSLLNRPERGWDPVPEGHAMQYGASEWASGANEQLLDELESRIGAFAGKEVLDLGGGPGQYSVALARRGAHVTWLDVSKRYRDFAAQKAKDAQVNVEFALGYMDDSARILRRQFDFVFNRICWSYCIDDSSFARVVYSLLKPGGWAFIDTNHCGVGFESAGAAQRARIWMNNVFGIKIGHPYPPRGRIEKLFRRFPTEQIIADYQPGNDRILLQRKAGAP